MRKSTLVVLSLLALGSLATAGPITVDGYLADWGVYVSDQTSADPFGTRTKYFFDKGVNLVGVHEEDTMDWSNSYNVGPNNGGQNYDAELLAAAIQGGNLYLGVLSGQRPDNGSFWRDGKQYWRYAPGDVRITTLSGNVYGFEVGGGAPWDLDALVIGGDIGSTYALTGGGWTKGAPQGGHTAEAVQQAGTLWLNPLWHADPIAPPEDTQLQFGGGSLEWSATLSEYVFKTMPIGTSTHSSFEASIPLAAFGGDTITMIEWRPSCGNDELIVELAPIPEPGTLVLAGGGLVLLALLRRRRST